MAMYRTREGDMLDAICLAYYGQPQGYVEAVLAVNSGLAELGPIFESGVIIELPDLPAFNQRQESIRLWS
jgi:phage tail protein X